MKKTRIILLLFSVMQLAGINSISANTGNGLHLTTASLKVKADGKELCTAELQQAIDRIAAQGGGQLTFTPGRYLTGGLMLRSGVELYLEEGATLLGSADPRHYRLPDGLSAPDNPDKVTTYALITACGAEHVTLAGRGTIDGQGLQLALTIDSLHHTGELIDPIYNVRRHRPNTRPSLFFFHQCRDIRVDSLCLKSSAGWGLSFEQCEWLTLSHLDVENRAYWNNDGIDVTDCCHVRISDCRVNAADDGICLKSDRADLCNYDVEIARCDIRSSASAVKFGTASWGGFRKIHVHDINIRDTFRSCIAIESVDGGIIDSVLVERIEAENTGNAIFLRLGQRNGERQGVLRHVTIRNLKCQVPFGRPDEAYDLRGPEVDFFHNPFPSSICGIPGNAIEDVLIENVFISYPGRATKGMAYMPLWRLSDVPEEIGKYPEFSMFGELPAWGFYVRHVNHITFRCVHLSLRDSDFRPAFVFDDVHQLTMEQVTPDESVFN